MSLSKNAQILLKSRYCRKNESFSQLFQRVADHITSNESFNKQLYDAMLNGYFLPSSPVLRNAGKKHALLHPCNVLEIPDSIEGIMTCLSQTATIFHHGGGVGFNASTLRPKGAPLSMGGTSSGVVSFLSMFDVMTDVVKQGGFRRGALMGILDFDHPEILNFITSKLRGDFTNFNISVMVTNEFMNSVISEKVNYVDLKFNGVSYGRVRSDDLFDQIIFSAYQCGDPGIIFYDRIQEDNDLFPKIDINATNPCVTGDTQVLTTYGYIPIGALVGENVSVWNGVEWSTVKPFSTGVNNIVEVHLTNGVVIHCTPYHKFVSSDYRMIEASNLKIGDTLGRYKLPILDGKDTPEIDGYSQGFYAGDGNNGLRKSRIYSTKYCCMKRLVGNIGKTMNGNSENDIRNWYHGQMLSKDFVPINASVYYKLNWLAGLCDSDGTVASNSIQITSINKDFLLATRLLLTTLGEETTVALSSKEKIKTIKGKDYKCKAVYRLVIAHSQVMNLINLGLRCCRLELPQEPPQRSAKRFIKVKAVYIVEGKEETFCFNESKKHLGTFNGVVTGQCGEVPLPPMTACNLGSINLSKFVDRYGIFHDGEYQKYVELGMKALKAINKNAWYPFPEMTRNMKSLDICGLGHMGLADMFIKMGIIYGSRESINFLDRLKYHYIKITDEIGGNSFYKRSQAPTGSLSIIADCSAGIEPVFERSFERHLTVGILQEVRELYKSKYCITAHEIDPIDHLKIQAKIQTFTDAAVSKTINLPHTASIENIRKIYINAWRSDCKGVTVFRDQSKEGVWKKSKCEGENCFL